MSILGHERCGSAGNLLVFQTPESNALYGTAVGRALPLGLTPVSVGGAVWPLWCGHKIAEKIKPAIMPLGLPRLQPGTAVCGAFEAWCRGT